MVNHQIQYCEHTKTPTLLTVPKMNPTRYNTLHTTTIPPLSAVLNNFFPIAGNSSKGVVRLIITPGGACNIVCAITLAADLTGTYFFFVVSLLVGSRNSIPFALQSWPKKEANKSI